MRWSFIATRIVVVLAILVLARLGINPMVRYVSIRAIENTVGARAEISQAEIDFFPPQIQYSDIRVGDPRSGKDKENIVCADQVHLRLNGNALLRRRFVVDDGLISGLQVGSARTTSGHLPSSQSPSTDEDSFLSEFLGNLGQSISNRLESIEDNLHTTRAFRDVRDRWETKYTDLMRRASDLESEIESVRKNTKEIVNPLRDIPQIQKTLQRAKSIRDELLALRTDMEQLPTDLETDCEAMEQAKREDLQMIDRYVPGDINELHDLGPAMVSKMVKEQINQALHFLNSGREIVDWTVAEPDLERQRGRTVALDGPSPPPEMLIRRCELNGNLSIDQDSYSMTGILENLTSETDRLEGPLRAKINLDGPRLVHIDFQRHYDATIPREQVVVQWPRLHIPDMHIGKSSKTSLSINGGPLELQVQISRTGEQISGELRSIQQDTLIHLDVPSDQSSLVLVQQLRRSLASIHHIEVVSKFRGTGNDFELTTSTNLDRSLSQGIQAATTKQLADTKRLLTQKIESEFHDQIKNLYSWLNDRHSETAQRLTQTNDQLDSLQKKLLRELPKARAYLSRFNSAFKDLNYE